MRYGSLVLAMLGMLLYPGFASASEDSNTAFSFTVTGEATLADGRTQPIDFKIAYQQSSRGWYFRAGNDVLYRDTPPNAYNLLMNLDGHGRAFITDFSEHPITAFTVRIEDTEIELIPAGPRVAFGLRLRINDRQFLFDSAHPRLHLELTETGLNHIYAERTLRDLSIRRAN